jgi:presenilin 1
MSMQSIGFVSFSVEMDEIEYEQDNDLASDSELEHTTTTTTTTPTTTTTDDSATDTLDTIATTQATVLVASHGDIEATSQLPTAAAAVDETVDDDRINLTQQPEQRSIKLGLGDFVFYSVLVGRAALYDIITVFVCFIAIVTGLFMTLLLLSIFRKALPALPFSIALGAMFYFLSRVYLVPFVIALGSAAIVV